MIESKLSKNEQDLISFFIGIIMFILTIGMIYIAYKIYSLPLTDCTKTVNREVLFINKTVTPWTYKKEIRGVCIEYTTDKSLLDRIKDAD